MYLSRVPKMKLLLLGLIPVLIFWFVEDKFGTFWGLIAAMVWAVGECGYEYVKYRRIDRLTLLSSGLVLGLGGVGAWLDKSVLFKFQPAILEAVFAGLLVWGGRGGEPFLLKVAKKSRPEIFVHQNEIVALRQVQMMKRMTASLIVVLMLHVALLIYVALKGTTGQWAFWKGVGFNIFLGIWLLFEVVAMRWQGRSG